MTHVAGPADKLDVEHGARRAIFATTMRMALVWTAGVLLGLHACGSEVEKPPIPVDVAAEGLSDPGRADEGVADLLGLDDGKPPTLDTAEDSSSDGAADVASPPDSACQGSYLDPVAAAHLATDDLVEASGIVAARRDPDILWLHNDSGDAARLFAVSTGGELLVELNLPGVAAYDFEDVAAAPCPDPSGPCLWVGDVGNNLKDRSELPIYVVPEPEVDGVAVSLEATNMWTYTVRYPGGPVDCEALVVRGDGQKLWLFEKTQGDARVYGTPDPMTTDGVMDLMVVATMASPGFNVPYGLMITAGDSHASGTRIALRLYTGTWEYRLDTPWDLASLGSVAPLLVAVGPLEEGQGEAVAYDAPGTGIWTVSEDTAGVGYQPLHHYGCAATNSP